MSNVIPFHLEASMRAARGRGTPVVLSVSPLEPIVERMLGAIRRTHAMLAQAESAICCAAAIERHLPEPDRQDYAAEIARLKQLLDVARDRARRI